MIIPFWEVDLPTDLSAEGFVLLGDYTEDDWTHRYFLYTTEELRSGRMQEDRADARWRHVYPKFLG